MVPYIARAATAPWGRTAARIAIGPFPKRVVQGIRGAQLMRKYGPTAARAAMTMGRAWRRSRNRRITNPYKRKPIMYRRTDKSAKNPARKKATDPAELSTAYSMSNLQVITYPWPAFDNGTLSSDNLISRNRNTLKISGIKICQRFSYNQPQTSETYCGPILVRWYLVQAKNAGAPTNANLSLGPNFFRTNNDGQNRNRNFNPGTGGIAESYDFAKICAPVNPDESFRIITKREFMLQGRTATSDQRTVPYMYTLKEWFPNGKKYTFDQVSSGSPNQEIYTVFWYYPVDEQQYDALANNNFFLTVNRHDITYYKEQP